MRDMLENKHLEITKIHTDRNVADMMTKNITMEKHMYCRDGTGME